MQKHVEIKTKRDLAAVDDGIFSGNGCIENETEKTKKLAGFTFLHDVFHKCSCSGAGRVR